MSEDIPELEAYRHRIPPEPGTDLPPKTSRKHSGRGWLASSPLTAIILSLLLADAGYRLGSALQLGYGRGERLAFIALGVVTGLVSLGGIYVSNTVRGVASQWNKALLWAFGCGVVGGVTFLFLFWFILWMTLGKH